LFNTILSPLEISTKKANAHDVEFKAEYDAAFAIIDAAFAIMYAVSLFTRRRENR
jgi:hypothetical protein